MKFTILQRAKQVALKQCCMFLSKMFCCVSLYHLSLSLVHTHTQSPPPYIPYEFTFEGLLERLAVYIENQDFCAPGHQWPPKSTLVAKVSEQGESCKDLCYRHGMVCEPELFPFLNTMDALRRCVCVCVCGGDDLSYLQNDTR